MGNFFSFVMDPVFSSNFMSHFAWMGDFGIIVLVLLKMAIMFAGTLLFMSPLIVLALPLIRPLYLSLLTEEELKGYMQKKAPKANRRHATKKIVQNRAEVYSLAEYKR